MSERGHTAFIGAVVACVGVGVLEQEWSEERSAEDDEVVGFFSAMSRCLESPLLVS